jgi:hypothetical protein
MHGIKYTPILYSTPMVKSLSKFIKTVTRRIIKPQPTALFLKHRNNFTGEVSIAFATNKTLNHTIYCPYGKIGDILWVKETFYAYGHWTTITENGKSRKKFHDLTKDNNYLHQYFAEWQPKKQAKFGELGWHKRPALFMPKIAARLFLMITDIRVERVQDITNEQAIKEGIEVLSNEKLQIPKLVVAYKDYMNDTNYFQRPDYSFRSLWVSINGHESWEANPYVWVVQFLRVDCPADFYTQNS